MVSILIETMMAWAVNNIPALRHHLTRMRNLTGVLGLLLLLAATILFASKSLAGIRLVDGDTIDVNHVRIRINAIDAPEIGQMCGSWACGEAALEEMAQMVRHGDVTCNNLGEDSYGRRVATCFADGVDIGREMVRNGFAWAYVKYSQEYVADETVARQNKLGIWSTDAIPAWEYRASKWAAAEQEAPNGCPIKGNISKNGMIYHAPWSPWYSKTHINTSQGERWFCSEAEAVANGWRAPYWH